MCKAAGSCDRTPWEGLGPPPIPADERELRFRLTKLLSIILFLKKGSEGEKKIVLENNELDILYESF